MKKRMTEEELGCLEQMRTYFLTRDPNNPYWHILDHMCFEIREQQKNLASCHSLLAKYAKIISKHKKKKQKKK